MMRKRRLIAMAMLGALTMVVLALPASANDDDDDDHDRRGGRDLPSLGGGGKLTVALLERGESQSLAEVYASEDTGRKVERAMRRGLIVHCYPGGYDTVSFTCEGATTPPETTTTGTTTGTGTTTTTGNHDDDESWCDDNESWCDDDDDNGNGNDDDMNDDDGNGGS